MNLDLSKVASACGLKTDIMDCSSGHISTGLLTHLKAHNVELIDDLRMEAPTTPSKAEQKVKDNAAKTADDATAAATKAKHIKEHNA